MGNSDIKGLLLPIFGILALFGIWIVAVFLSWASDLLSRIAAHPILFAVVVLGIYVVYRHYYE